MTDRENVIRGLECCQLDVNKCLDCPYLDKRNKVAECGIELHRDVLALLKAQEPRTVLSIFKAHEGTFGNCPACGAELMDYYNEERCGRCGQEVKWE